MFAALKKLLLAKKPVVAGSVNIAFYEDGIAMAQVVDAEGPLIKNCNFYQYPKVKDSLALLSDIVKENQWQGADCHWVLKPRDYKLLLIDAPEVPEEEMRDAVRWQVKDLLDYPLENAALDVFHMPSQRENISRKMIYVVAAQISHIQAHINDIQAAGLKLTKIDITELALRNIAASLPEDEDGVGMLYLYPGNSLLAICRQQQLFLARPIHITVESILETQVGAKNFTQEHEQLYDNIYLEVQRSLDYYESQISVGPLSKLYLLPTTAPCRGLAKYLAEQLTCSFASLDLNQHLSLEQELLPKQQAGCFAVIGAGLRDEEGWRAATS